MPGAIVCVSQRERLSLHFLTTRPELLQRAASNGGFDTIVALDVLEHIPDLAAVLELFASLLAPGGRLIVNVPFSRQP